MIPLSWFCQAIPPDTLATEEPSIHAKSDMLTTIITVTANRDIFINLGTRHRAGIGLSEKTDAVVIITSEQTGEVSISINGALKRDIKEEELAKILFSIFGKNTENKKSLLEHLKQVFYVQKH